jgi:hypothetical protein
MVEPPDFAPKGYSSSSRGRSQPDDPEWEKQLLAEEIGKEHAR